MSCGLGLCRTGGNQDAMPRDIYGIPDEWAQQSYVWAQPCDGVEEIRKAIRKLVGQNVDHIKFFATGGGLWEKDRVEDMHFGLEEMRTIVDEAHMVGLKVMCHAENLQGIRAAVELGVDTIEHGDNEEGCELDEETCQKMAEKNIFLTPTLSINFVGEWAEEGLPEYVINGWKRAITSATKFGAEACGIDSRVGTIEKGKLADLLVLKKDPTRNIDILLDKGNIRYIMKEGNLVVEH